eukprot:COSAG01_NODE_759_length_13802_cov_16.155221_13_plen_127_part_00
MYQSCQSETYSATHQTKCWPCAKGESDHDSDPATPCQECKLGQYMPVGRTGACEDYCPGFTDEDLAPDTPCTHCTDNTYAPLNGTSGPCPLCSVVAGVEVDQDHATPPPRAWHSSHTSTTRTPLRG